MLEFILVVGFIGIAGCISSAAKAIKNAISDSSTTLRAIDANNRQSPPAPNSNLGLSTTGKWWAILGGLEEPDEVIPVVGWRLSDATTTAQPVFASDVYSWDSSTDFIRDDPGHEEKLSEIRHKIRDRKDAAEKAVASLARAIYEEMRRSQTPFDPDVVLRGSADIRYIDSAIELLLQQGLILFHERLPAQKQTETSPALPARKTYVLAKSETEL